MGGTDIVATGTWMADLAGSDRGLCSMCAGGTRISDGIFSWGQYCGYPNVCQNLECPDLWGSLLFP